MLLQVCKGTEGAEGFVDGLSAGDIHDTETFISKNHRLNETGLAIFLI